MTDPIADMLTRIRNAYMARRESVKIPHSRIKEEIIKILTQEGYIGEFTVKNTTPQKRIDAQLSYKGKLAAIDGIQRVSSPGRRVYVRADKIPQTLGGYGINIISTNKGIMTGKLAKKQRLGGEVLCKVW